MKTFLKNFTNAISRRFNSTAIDLAPREFDGQAVTFISDIERPFVQNVACNATYANDLIATNTSRQVAFQFAVRNQNLAGQWGYNLQDISKIVLKSHTFSAELDRGIGGSGNYTFEFAIRVQGAGAAIRFADAIYTSTTTIPVAAGTIQTLRPVYFQDGITIFNGDTIFPAAVNVGASNRPAIEYILLQFGIFVPNTAADLVILDGILIWNLEITFANGDTEERTINAIIL